jgi:hypothetical protein
MDTKMGLVEKTKRGEKEGKKDMANNEKYHVCAGTRHNETH